MTKNQTFFVFVVGFLLTLGGVGGVEHSVDNAALIDSVIVSVVGLMIMAVGALAINRENYYEQTRDNPTLR